MGTNSESLSAYTASRRLPELVQDRVTCTLLNEILTNILITIGEEEVYSCVAFCVLSIHVPSVFDRQLRYPLHPILTSHVEEGVPIRILAERIETTRQRRFDFFMPSMSRSAEDLPGVQLHFARLRLLGTSV